MVRISRIFRTPGGGIKTGQGSFTPAFNMKQVREVAEKFALEQEVKIIQVLFKIGEDFVDRARLSGTYQNRTNNLRSSIGYAVFKYGMMIAADFTPSGDGYEGSGAEGIAKGTALAQNVALRYPGGLVLVVTAGMEYAFYVEAKGFDVITGSEPSGAEVKEYLDAIIEGQKNKASQEE